MSIYLDASILVALLRVERGSNAAAEFVNAATEPLLVSDFAVGEVASAVARLVRTGEITADVGTERLAAFDDWVAAASSRLATDANDIQFAARLVRRFGLGVRMPDAVHVASAQIRGAKLATMDQKMAMVAEQLQMDRVFVHIPVTE